MRSTVFVAIDTETTGLCPGFDQLVEIAACRFRDGEFLGSYETLINPGRDIPAEVTALHGITIDMVKDSPSGEEAVREFFKFVGNDPLIAHNAPFDEKFISYNCHRHDIQVPDIPLFDTLQLSRRLFPELKSHGLASLTKVFNVPHEVKHRGMPDVIGLRGVFEECVNRLALKGIVTKEQFDRWYGDPVRFSPEKYNLLVKLSSEYQPLQTAIENGDCLEVVYEDRSGSRTRRRIQPQGLYVAYGNLYLTAYCHLREANRNFKLERIHAFRIVEINQDSDKTH
jgi:DNA polymerase III epsilon subunit family exonuclease